MADAGSSAFAKDLGAGWLVQEAFEELQCADPSSKSAEHDPNGSSCSAFARLSKARPTESYRFLFSHSSTDCTV